jgi:hypothetical protein
MPFHGHLCSEYNKKFCGGRLCGGSFTLDPSELLCRKWIDRPLMNIMCVYVTLNDNWWWDYSVYLKQRVKKCLILYWLRLLNKVEHTQRPVKSRDNMKKRGVKAIFFSWPLWLHFSYDFKSNQSHSKSLATRHWTRWTKFFFLSFMRLTLESPNLLVVSKLGGVFHFVQNPFKVNCEEPFLVCSVCFFFAFQPQHPTYDFKS